MASLSADAWRDLRRNPVFWIAAAIVLLMVLLAAFPDLFSHVPIRARGCDLVRIR